MDFICLHCHAYVSADRRLSGVHNRNHCPYCLWSRHLDLEHAGDRFSACKEQMRPVGLTFKRIRNKYGRQEGELMLVHQCMDCGSVSINRIAADDDVQTLESLAEISCGLDEGMAALLNAAGIAILAASERGLARSRLVGWAG